MIHILAFRHLLLSDDCNSYWSLLIPRRLCDSQVGFSNEQPEAAGSGDPAAATFFESLADADVAALKLCKQSLNIIPPVAYATAPRGMPSLHAMTGDPAAATFFESLADADVAALKRLINV